MNQIDNRESFHILPSFFPNYFVIWFFRNWLLVCLDLFFMSNLWSWLKFYFYSSFILLSLVQIYIHEESNHHSGALVFLLGHLFSSIPFLFLISISSSLVFYFLVGMRDEFSLLMYFVLNFFMCLLVNEGLMMVVASICLEPFRSILTMVTLHVSANFSFKFCFNLIGT